MIHTTPDFFNKVAIEMRSTYFPTEIHGITENKDYHKTTRTLELFNNGCINYRQLIGRLAKSCNDTTSKINSIVEKYIVSFGNYQYKPCK
jgi:hypothetical protein